MKNRSGFTLIEILVVLGILGITIPVFLTVSAYTRNMNYEARMRTTATLLAEQKAEELVAQSASLRTQLQTESLISRSGSEPPYTWESSVTMNAALDQVEIIVWVRWRYNGKDRSLQVATYAR